MKKKVVILTGNETRHKYFKLKLSSDKRFKIIASYCEDNSKNVSSKWLGLKLNKCV